MPEKDYRTPSETEAYVGQWFTPCPNLRNVPYEHNDPEYRGKVTRVPIPGIGLVNISLHRNLEVFDKKSADIPKTGVILTPQTIEYFNISSHYDLIRKEEEYESLFVNFGASIPLEYLQVKPKRVDKSREINYVLQARLLGNRSVFETQFLKDEELNESFLTFDSNWTERRGIERDLKTYVFIPERPYTIGKLQLRFTRLK